MHQQKLDQLDKKALTRLCLQKRAGIISSTWAEIAERTGYTGNPDSLRNLAYGMQMCSESLWSEGGATRILALSDLHCPFHLSPVTFTQWAGRVDILVLNGDLEDCQSISKFPKKYRVPLIEEMKATRSLITQLLDIIRPKTCYIVKGNHEHRLLSKLSEDQNADFLSLMPDSPLDLIVNEGFRERDRLHGSETIYEPLRQIYKDKVDLIYTGDWHIKIGKTLFVHPLSYSSATMGTAKKATEYFLRADPDFDCLVMAHTHKLGSYYQGDILMLEQGCCCDLSRLDYADGKLQMPATNGYAYLEQTPGGQLVQNSWRLIRI